uniref:Uncharacterized protein n=1 Tax=uncultured Planctomycetota bacterium TaxID=120965 RepID=A0A1B0Z235_9BACT|nr:hypothetical protein [uncultured Planctomycetota bacterium]
MVSSAANFAAQIDMLHTISKNKDRTQLCNFRFRVSDVKLLDRFAKRKQWSRTRALEELIRRAPLAKQEKK